jgi:ABC-type transport system substrate-binding protein
LIKAGARESDPAKRHQIYVEAQKILNEDEVPMIPIYYYRDESLVSKRIKNYPVNAMNKFYTWDMEIVE